MILGSASVNSTADLTTTMTLGFKPKIILCVCIASSSGAAHSFFGTGFWSDSSGQMWSGSTSNCVSSPYNETGYIIRTDKGESHGEDREVTIINVTETAFDIFFDYLGTPASGSSATINYIAFGE